jgi:hypothetical protein
MREKRHRRNLRERGASLVESALYFLLFLALVTAMLDYGFVIFLKGTFQHAVREGVRYAVTWGTSGVLGHDDSIRKIVMEQSMGFIKNANKDKVKIRYYRPDTLVEVSGVGSNQPGYIVQVSIEGYQWKWISPMNTAGMSKLAPSRDYGALTMNAYALDRMEGLPTGMFSPPPR